MRIFFWGMSEWRCVKPEPFQALPSGDSSRNPSPVNASCSVQRPPVGGALPLQFVSFLPVVWIWKSPLLPVFFF